MDAHRWFHNKVIVVTGSARGIGRETARLALAAGARVVLNGRDPESVRATAEALGYPDRTLAVAADLSRPAEAVRLVATVLGTWGQIDGVVNNAGLSMRGAFADLSESTVRTMVDANLLSAVWMTQAALPALRRSRGRVLFVSSLAGARGFAGVSLYSAAKLALSAVADGVQAEEGHHGVRAGVIWLAFTENDPGKTVVGADGAPFHHERRWSLTQEQTARRILKALAQGRRRTVLTAQGRLLVWAQAWFPGLVDRALASSGGRLHAARTVEAPGETPDQP